TFTSTVVEFPSLIWLSVSGSHGTTPLFLCSYWWMPQLKHLAVLCPNGVEDYLVDGLFQVGGNLKSLQLIGEFELVDESSLARLCAKLRQLTFDWTPDPPLFFFHPTLEELTIHSADEQWTTSGGMDTNVTFLLQFMAAHKHRWPNLRTIVDTS